MCIRDRGYSFRISDVTVGRIIHETCCSIWDSIHYAMRTCHFLVAKMLMKYQEDFRGNGNFQVVWDVSTGSIFESNVQNNLVRYYNYKKYFSIVLQAVVGPDYKFICIDIGAYGKQSDSGIFH